ncbi:MAG TPA: DNA-3-methyladenine glycosylase 2 family protein [Panacibacter sp.]|nr:DNA-3-methyladenine glycosylase 2 family protein [Panacibacter sp.]
MQHVSHLQKDKKFAAIINEPLDELQTGKNIALTLIASIMSQQLSTKVAAVIHKRFLALYGSNEPSLQQVLDTSLETLRSIGLSNAKTNYVHNVAKFFMENNITDKKIKAMGNDEIIALFTQIKGVGQWTVEMLLMFTLGREDVVALDDLGIQQAMIKLYKLDKLDKKQLREKMIRLSARWSPYRTYACLYLWRWKDSK